MRDTKHTTEWREKLEREIRVTISIAIATFPEPPHQFRHHHHEEEEEHETASIHEPSEFCLVHASVDRKIGASFVQTHPLRFGRNECFVASCSLDSLAWKTTPSLILVD